MERGDTRAVPVSISLYPAQLRELDRLADAMGLTRSDLMQQAVNVLINQLGKVLHERGNEATKVPSPAKPVDQVMGE